MSASKESKAPYHHGDLRAALVTAALELLDESGETDLSLRAVARRAGVSPAAPSGITRIAKRSPPRSRPSATASLLPGLASAHPCPSTPEQLASVAVAYVQFALDRPALFRIMFGEPCDRDNDERAAATGAVSLYVRAIAERTFPQADPDALATAIWALVHGLAFLYLDGKLDASTPQVVADRITAAIQALLTATTTHAEPAVVDAAGLGQRAQ